MTDDAERRVDGALLHGWPLPDPGDATDKEARGRVLIVAGCRELPGAAILCAEAALRAGAGKVIVATGASIATMVGIAVPEARVLALPETAEGGLQEPVAQRLDEFADHAAALLVGPGLLDEASTCRLVLALLARHPRLPTLLDAGALHAVTVDSHSRRPILVTPHAGELAHLSDLPKSMIEADAAAQARAASARWNAVVALKGATTRIASTDGSRWRHDGGDIGLATAGSGDVLAGLMAGLAARGCTLEQAAVWAVALHAQAGARLAARIGRLGYLAREIAAEIPRLADRLSIAPSAAR
jgi:ADP-dependent NAD(P)H-hydrate dehydratase